MSEGIDYAWAPEITDERARRINRAGKHFACRYVSPDRTGKNLTRREARTLADAGVSVAANFEWNVGRPEGGYHVGKADAELALRQARDCGMPEDRPIYFSVDYDTTVGPHITGYFEGVASVLGLAHTGAYGSYTVIRQLFDKGLISFGWQTYAWSRSRFEKRAQLYQHLNGVNVAGISCDLDTAFGDAGLWKPGESVVPNRLHLLTKHEQWAVLKHRRAIDQRSRGRIVYWRGELSFHMRRIRVAARLTGWDKHHRRERHRQLKKERARSDAQ